MTHLEKVFASFSQKFAAVILFAIMGLFIYVEDATAQEIYFGPKIGLNISTILGEAAYGTNMTEYSNSPLYRFCFGGLFEYKIARNFGLAAEILYSQQGFEYQCLFSDEEKKRDVILQYDYLIVPLMVEYYPIKGNSNFSMHAGLQPSIFISGKSKDKYNTDAKWSDGPKNYINSIDLSVPIGVSYAFNPGLKLTARVALGTSGVVNNDAYAKVRGLNYTPQFKFTNLVFQVGLSYRFGKKDRKEEKPCYTVKEIISLLEQDMSVRNKRICLFNYKTDDAEVDSKSYSELDELVELMNKMGRIEVKIYGHTDDRGSAEHNKELSTKRAKGVYDYMVKKGISKSRLSYEGFGLEYPIATNDTEAGRKQNRRVEFEIKK